MRIRSVCKHHDYHLTERSNVIQLDAMGYPLRLYIRTCSKCGLSEQVWIDVDKSILNEVDTGNIVLLEWKKIKN